MVDREKRDGKEAAGRLLPSLYDDTSAGPDLDAQVMAVEETHTHQGDCVGGVGIDLPRVTVPQDRHAVHVEYRFTAIG